MRKAAAEEPDNGMLAGWLTGWMDDWEAKDTPFKGSRFSIRSLTFHSVTYHYGAIVCGGRAVGRWKVLVSPSSTQRADIKLITNQDHSLWRRVVNPMMSLEIRRSYIRFLE